MLVCLEEAARRSCTDASTCADRGGSGFRFGLRLVHRRLAPFITMRLRGLVPFRFDRDYGTATAYRCVCHVDNQTSVASDSVWRTPKRADTRRLKGKEKEKKRRKRGGSSAFARPSTSFTENDAPPNVDGITGCM